MLRTFLLLLLSAALAHAHPDSTLIISKTTDFTINGEGTASNWSAARWFDITVQKGPRQPAPGRQFTTRVKVMYSGKGMYFLFDCADKKLTATIMEDYGALYNEDVVEVFLWPDTAVPIYLEYEVSPLNYELPILVPNINGRAQGWKPWNYNDRNRVQHQTSVQGGQKKSMAAVDGWKAEFFIPYALMNPIVGPAPVSGTKWRGNFYRIDYDSDPAYYSWQKTGGSFHEFNKFGTLIFE
ncbi:carbohydrate-binding family 9-like protein [Dyadobacter sandarakinus]|uniref:Carbohydrate-binding family 9-like protein n=1 Tax=Dyadobacter sandarakinus TaxID=2747268 RepID=A0ABX7I796_9BACT|nr:carbohydrate-binding family 9-like protein [Dyadobacter sandarakinus]QRR01053.1 carbohydrate-binding family 9-like protein [Dyadobacter sandarakinus]